MTVSLPKAVDAYFAGSNAHAPEIMALAFAADATVTDENKTHRGRSAITAWAQDTVDKYRMTITPLSATERDGKAIVKARVEGTFPGSPIELTFSFELGDGAIKTLKIG